MDTKTLKASDKWFQNWFDSDHYLKLYHGRDEKEAEKLAKLICETSGIEAGSRVLDVGCGAGRHSIIFSKAGYRVTGFDLSRHLLLEAKANSICRKTDVSLVRGDIRHLPFKSEFDLVLNIFTSWGYFESDAENIAALERAIFMKKPGGTFVLDFLNSEYLKKNLVPCSETEYEGVIYKENRFIHNERVIKTIEFFDGSNKNCFKESVRLFSYNQIMEVFKKIRVSKISLFGDYDGGKFDETKSPRIICLVS